MAIEVPQNEEISGRGKNGGREGIGSALRWEGANREAYTLRNESEEELLREMLNVTVHQEKEENEETKKGKRGTGEKKKKKQATDFKEAVCCPSAVV